MQYTIRRSQKAKRMRLSIKSNGELTLVLPRFVPEIAGKAFVQANRLWIKRHQDKLALKVSDFQQYEFITGTGLVFFDQKKYTIKIIRALNSKPTYVLEADKLSLKVPHKNSQESIKSLIEKFYRDQAREYLSARSQHFATWLGTDFNELRIKNTKSRWGSCSSKKNLNYNWRIMMAPKEVIDYLVIHEVCHLKQMNHSAKFWALVESLDPDFKIHKKWLRDNQERLLNFLQYAA